MKVGHNLKGGRIYWRKTVNIFFNQVENKSFILLLQVNNVIRSPMHK